MEAQSEISNTFEAAVKQGVVAVQALRDKGTAVDQQDEFGMTLLMHAILHIDIDVIDHLLDAGASLTLKDNAGFDAEDHAVLTKVFQLPDYMRARKRLIAA